MLQQLLLKRGFLVNAANDEVIRIAPAYVVSDRQIMSFVLSLQRYLRGDLQWLKKVVSPQTRDVRS